MVTDTISDMLTRIRNANQVKHQIVQIPATKMSVAIASILKEEGFIEDFETYSEGLFQYILISLKYKTHTIMDMKKFPKNLQFSISDNPLPHNFVAEKIVLSSLLINYEAIEITLKTVRVETFYFINHQEIYKAIIEMYRNKLMINVFSLNDFLKKTAFL